MGEANGVILAPFDGPKAAPTRSLRTRKVSCKAAQCRGRMEPFGTGEACREWECIPTGEEPPLRRLQTSGLDGLWTACGCVDVDTQEA